MLKKHNHFFIIFVYCLLAITACLPKVKPNYSIEPPADNNNYWFGTGEGYRMEEACGRALKRIASKISVVVSSKLKIGTRCMNDNCQQQFEENIMQSINDTYFPGYDVIKIDHLGNTTYVLIKVDKKKFLSFYQNKFLMKDKSILNMYNQLIDLHVLRILKRKQEWFSLLEEAKTMSLILSTFNVLEPYNIVINKHMQYKDKIDRKLNSATFFIQYNSYSRYVAEYMKELLTENNIQIVHSKTNNPFLSVMEIEGHVKQEKIEDEFLVRLSLDIQLKTKENVSIIQKNFQIPGVSLLGFDSALENASKLFYENVKTTGISDIFGF
jgi:hypothetical protein